MSIFRNRIFLVITGSLVILLVCLAPRIFFFMNSVKVPGKVVVAKESVMDETGRQTLLAPVVAYTIEDSTYLFKDESVEHYQNGDPVTMIYKKDDPGNAKIFSFMGFWFAPLAISILPLLLFNAAIFSFLPEKKKK